MCKLIDPEWVLGATERNLELTDGVHRMNKNSVAFKSRIFVVKLRRLARMFDAKQTGNICILE